MRKVATPFPEPAAVSWWAMELARRAPEALSGWPIAVAPPSGLTTSGSSSGSAVRQPQPRRTGPLQRPDQDVRHAAEPEAADYQRRSVLHVRERLSGAGHDLPHCDAPRVERL
jgi:hypothetical protein